MEKSKQERVVELYKEKSKLYDDLSNISQYTFIVGYNVPMSMYGSSKLTSVSDPFLAEIKKLTEVHLQQRIEEIDKELNEL